MRAEDGWITPASYHMREKRRAMGMNEVDGRDDYIAGDGSGKSVSKCDEDGKEDKVKRFPAIILV